MSFETNHTDSILAQLKADKEIESKATKAPWNKDAQLHEAMVWAGGMRIARLSFAEFDHQNAKFIAHARNTFLARTEALELAVRVIQNSHPYCIGHVESCRACGTLRQIAALLAPKS